MITNFILTCLLLIAGVVAALIVLFLGMSFCRNDNQIEVNPSIKWYDFLSLLLKEFPFWIWIVAFIVFQPCIPQTLRIWFPTWWSSREWIISFSSCIAFVASVIYIISVATVNYNINDEEKLDQWDCFKNYKTPSGIHKEFFNI